MNLVFQYPIWYLPLCVVVGAGLAFVLYRNETSFSKENTGHSWVKGLMFALRMLLFSLAAALLLSPLLKYNSNQTVKPVIVILKDASESVRLNNTADDLKKYNDALDNLRKQLPGDFDVQYFEFGDALHQPVSESFNEKTTDIYGAIDEALNRYEGQNLGAIILGSDGIYNRGNNPLYHPALSKVPIYTIATGDTTVKRDAFVGEVTYNRVVYLGNSFSIGANIGATGASGAQVVYRVQQIRDGSTKPLTEKNVSINGAKFSQDEDIVVQADAAGLQHYRISITDAGNEATLLNNAKDIYVEVRENKDRVLILADAPHPDLAAITSALDENRNYQVDVKLPPDYNFNPQDYSLAIFHQLPTGDQRFNDAFAKLKQAGKPVLFILGAETVTGPFNSVQTGLKINGASGNTNNAQAITNAQFTLFNLSDDALRKIQLFPPLLTLYGEYKAAPQLDVMFYQKIGNVSTKFPLVAFDQTLDPKIGYVTGEGLWRWRLYDYLQNKSHDAFNEFISRITQYMAVKADKKQFRVTLQRSAISGSSQVFGENENLKFNGELYNETYQPVNTPDVNVLVRSSEGKEFRYVMNKVAGGYSLDAGSLPTGSYNWTATTTFNNKKLSESGSVTISPVQVEAVNLTADHRLLNQLAQKSGGVMLYPGNENALVDSLKKSDTVKPIMYSTQRTESVINLKALFFILLTFAAIEWFMRKFFGGY